MGNTRAVPRFLAVTRNPVSFSLDSCDLIQWEKGSEQESVKLPDFRAFRDTGAIR
jgi:hypothetical protein